jgi:hypothetical protein
MYPAQALLNGQYKAVDLPDIIVWSNAESGAIKYNKITNQAVQGLQVYYLAEGSPPIGSGDENIVGINEDEYQWVRWTGGSIGGPGMCLISSQVGGDEFIDQFADSYTVTDCSYPSVIGATVSRVSQCTWQGTFLDPTNPYADGPQGVYIVYCPGEFQGCGAGLLFENENGVEVPFFYSAFDIGGSGGAFAKKTPHANTPAGNYEGEMSITFE